MKANSEAHVVGAGCCPDPEAVAEEPGALFIGVSNRTHKSNGDTAEAYDEGVGSVIAGKPSASDALAVLRGELVLVAL